MPATAASIQDKLLDAMKTTQDRVVTATKSVAERLEPVTKRVPPPPSWVPSAADSVERWFASQEKLLASMKEFSTKLVSAVSPRTTESDSKA
jgi:hypothetical protein